MCAPRPNGPDRSHQSLANSDGGCLQLRMRPELAEDVLRVLADRLNGDVQLIGDGLRGLPRRDPPENLTLSRREAIGRRLGGSMRARGSLADQPGQRGRPDGGAALRGRLERTLEVRERPGICHGAFGPSAYDLSRGRSIELSERDHGRTRQPFDNPGYQVQTGYDVGVHLDNDDDGLRRNNLVEEAGMVPVQHRDRPVAVVCENPPEGLREQLLPRDEQNISGGLKGRWGCRPFVHVRTSGRSLTRSGGRPDRRSVRVAKKRTSQSFAAGNPVIPEAARFCGKIAACHYAIFGSGDGRA